MDNLYRRAQILEVLRSEHIGTQSELKRKLERRGIRVTQATISRDIEELGVLKSRDGYRVGDLAPAVAPLQPTLQVLLKEFATSIKQASNLVIVKTHPGNAHSVAVALDAEPWPEIAGTIAGDDTIFVAALDQKEAARLHKKMRQLLEE